MGPWIIRKIIGYFQRNRCHLPSSIYNKWGPLHCRCFHPSAYNSALSWKLNYVEGSSVGWVAYRQPQSFERLYQLLNARNPFRIKQISVNYCCFTASEAIQSSYLKELLLSVNIRLVQMDLWFFNTSSKGIQRSMPLELGIFQVQIFSNSALQGIWWLQRKKNSRSKNSNCSRLSSYSLLMEETLWTKRI